MISGIRKFFRRKPLVVVIRLDGVIGAVSRFGSGGLDDSNTQKLLEKAFEFEKAKAIAIKINSPGGSPTQSSLIASRILKLSEEKKIPVLCFCEDVAASGGYWLACAGEEIYSDINSIIKLPHTKKVQKLAETKKNLRLKIFSEIKYLITKYNIKNL